MVPAAQASRVPVWIPTSAWARSYRQRFMKGRDEAAIVDAGTSVGAPAGEDAADGPVGAKRRKATPSGCKPAPAVPDDPKPPPPAGEPAKGKPGAKAKGKAKAKQGAKAKAKAKATPSVTDTFFVASIIDSWCGELSRHVPVIPVTFPSLSRHSRHCPVICVWEAQLAKPQLFASISDSLRL